MKFPKIKERIIVHEMSAVGASTLDLNATRNPKLGIVLFSSIVDDCTRHESSGRMRSGEEGYISQIWWSRKHKQRGLTKNQKLLSSPIDFFSTKTFKIWRIVENVCLLLLRMFCNWTNSHKHVWSTRIKHYLVSKCIL